MTGTLPVPSLTNTAAPNMKQSQQKLSIIRKTQPATQPSWQAASCRGQGMGQGVSRHECPQLGAAAAAPRGMRTHICVHGGRHCESCTRLGSWWLRKLT